jgi:hypothetical protein
MDAKTFWTVKSPLAEYHAVVFEHPAFEAPIRLVANEFAPVTLSGHEHQPSAMSVKSPERKGDSQPRLSLTFPRQVVGREFKRQLSLINGAQTLQPIKVTYSIYLGSVTAPEVTWELFVSDQAGVAFTGDAVQVTATDDNNMRRSVAPIYTPDVFTGLELI